MDWIASRVKQLWPILIHSPNICMDRVEENYENPASD